MAANQLPRREHTFVVTEQGREYLRELDRTEPWYAAQSSATLACMFPTKPNCAMRHTYVALGADGFEVTIVLPKEAIVYRGGKPVSIPIEKAAKEFPDLLEDLMREQMGLPMRKELQQQPCPNNAHVTVTGDERISEWEISPKGMGLLSKLRRKPKLSKNDAIKLELLECVTAAEEFEDGKNIAQVNAECNDHRVIMFPRP